jgi:hypothetical protein
MIYEYAVDPILLVKKETCSNIANSFGPEKGRLISSFPEEWGQLVKKLIHKTYREPARKHSKERLIKLIKKGAILKQVTNNSWTDRRGWLTNAITENSFRNENSFRPFRAIIADVPKADSDRNIIPGQNADDFYPRWKTECQITVPRKANKMAEAIQPLLELSSEIVFVDRFFSPNSIWFRKVLECFLEIVKTRHSSIPVTRIIYHFSLQRKKTDEKQFKEDATKKLAPIIPKGINLIFMETKDGDFHDRYVLTDIGSVDMGIGLQEYEPNSDSEKSVCIKNIGLARDKFNDFTPEEIFHQVQGEK